VTDHAGADWLMTPDECTRNTYTNYIINQINISLDVILDIVMLTNVFLV